MKPAIISEGNELKHATKNGGIAGIPVAPPIGQINGQVSVPQGNPKSPIVKDEFKATCAYCLAI